MISSLVVVPGRDFFFGESTVIFFLTLWACKEGEPVEVAAVFARRIFGYTLWGLETLTRSAEVGDVFVNDAEGLIHDRAIFASST